MARLDWLRTRYPAEHKRALVLPVLSMAQREFGFVGEEVVRFVAAEIPVPEMWVEEVASFYSMFNRRPIGRWHLQVCRNLSCSIMGAEIVAAHLEETLGIRPGGTTADGEFTLSLVECLGACGSAPVMQVNDRYCENLSLRDVDDLILRLRASPDETPGAREVAAGPGTGPGRRLAGAVPCAAEGVDPTGEAATPSSPPEAAASRPKAPPRDAGPYRPLGMASEALSSGAAGTSSPDAGRSA